MANSERFMKIDEMLREYKIIGDETEGGYIIAVHFSDYDGDDPLKAPRRPAMPLCFTTYLGTNMSDIKKYIGFEMDKKFAYLAKISKSVISNDDLLELLFNAYNKDAEVCELQTIKSISQKLLLRLNVKDYLNLN